MSQTKIKCPNCGIEINVDEIFEHQAEEKFRTEYENRLAEQIASLNKKKEEATREVLKLKRMKEDQDDIIRKKLEEEKDKLKSEAFFLAKKDVEFEMLRIKQENEIKSKENLQLKKKEVEIMNKERQLKDKAEQLEIDVQRMMLDKEKEIQEKAVRMEQEKNNIKKKEYEQQLENQQKTINDLKNRENELKESGNKLLEKTEQLKIQNEKMLIEKTREAEEAAVKREKEKSVLMQKEYDLMVESQKKTIDEMRKKEEEMKITEIKLRNRTEEIKAEAERLIQEKIKEVEEQAVKTEREKSKLKQQEYEKQVEEQKMMIDEMKRKEIELKNKELEFRNRAEEEKLESEKQFVEKAKELEERAVRREQERNELKQREYDKKLEDQKKLIDELKKKAELGSQQLQGEVQELALEEFLKASFPFDVITEVKKGERGADAIHTVRNNLLQDCGKIIYESKRTKAFSESWIEKLREDQKNHQADIAVIVTETMPREMEKFGLRQGVWICSYQEIKSLSVVLREMLIRTQSVKIIQENKGEKKDMLYSYLTSNEFVQQIEAIVEGFTGLLSDLQKEKNAMERMWSTREKQIRKVLINTSSMYGSIRGISGNVIGSIKALELPESHEEE